MQLKFVYIFWTCKDQSEAKSIIHALLHQRLIACASLFPEVHSIYRWDGKIEEASEVKVILKTQAKHFDPIQQTIERHCSYEVPEIVQVDIDRMAPRYQAWLMEETTNPAIEPT